MPGAAIGALLGAAFSSTIIGWGLAATWLGAVMIGASIGSLFDAQEIDLGSSTPNYAFGQLSNTKSQLLPVPIVYGRCRVGGNVFMQAFYDDSMQKMDMFVGVSEGPIQSIKSVYANDLVLIDENGDVVHELAESSLNLHLGEPDQVADSRDPGANAYPNTAYIALTLKAQDGLSGNPVISSIVEGRKVWTPSGTVFTRNPAWIVYDFLTNTRYGVGIPTKHIDLDSFTAAATYCDHPIDGEPRFTLDYIIDTQRPAVDHLQAMLGCFRGYFLARDKIELHVEQSGSVYKALGPDNFVKDSFTWWQKSGDDSPNRIVIEWIDPNNHYEQSSAPFEIQEDIQARGVFEKSISLLGVTRPEQVGRLGNYLLETARRVQNFCAFQVSLKDADIEAGEIVSITYPDFTGWSAKPFRVLAVQDEGQTGTVTLTCAEYDAAVYSDDGLNVDSPIQDSPPVTYDDIYALTLDDVGHQEGDGTWVPVVRATWQNPSDYTPTAINVRWRHDGETDWTLHINSTRLITQANIPGLETGRAVEVWVNCVRPDTGRETAGKIARIIVGKDTTPPGAPTSLTATGWFGSILLEWVNPTDADLKFVEVWECSTDNRAASVKIAETAATAYDRYLGSFQGRYYWVRAVDLSGNVSQWNADAGVYGYSDMANAKDFWDELLKHTEVGEAVEWLGGHIDSLAESHILTLLGDADDAWKAALEQRKAEKLAELQIAGTLGNFDDYRWTLAAITEEKTTRETAEEALARWVRSVEAMIGDPANPGEGTVFAALREELEARARADEALSRKVTTLEATIGDPWNPGEGTVYAALREEQSARVNRDEALAADITTLAAGIGDPTDPAPGTVYAVISDERTARAMGDSALAQKQSTLQTQLNGNTASIQQLLQSMDGVKAQWGVRLDINGRVTGLTLLGGQGHTSMVFNVDSFIIQTPDGGVPPFMLGTVDGRTQVVMRNAFIEDASIVGAKIKTATIGDLHIRDFALTNTFFWRRVPEDPPENTSWRRDLVYGVVSKRSADALILTAGGVFNFNSGSYDYHGGFDVILSVGGSTLVSMNYYRYVMKNGGTGTMPFTIAAAVPSGSFSGNIQVLLSASCPGGSTQVTKGKFGETWLVCHQVRK